MYHTPKLHHQNTPSSLYAPSWVIGLVIIDISQKIIHLLEISGLQFSSISMLKIFVEDGCDICDMEQQAQVLQSNCTRSLQGDGCWLSNMFKFNTCLLKKYQINPGYKEHSDHHITICTGNFTIQSMGIGGSIQIVLSGGLEWGPPVFLESSDCIKQQYPRRAKNLFEGVIGGVRGSILLLFWLQIFLKHPESSKTPAVKEGPNYSSWFGNRMYKPMQEVPEAI
ncbi:hypothetical protein B0H17DRAFT_1148901 [Mycena rosella]|uniref:Uncharacterized protein n=1 Tax=Mycena rosella TaxID=1033263 RepID=A0AAD7C6U4_MYCRO|nr:hypothetical protein B0H17DRAFT_1148901 [Mycena rosella]